MSDAEQQYGLRIQELESKLEALEEELSEQGEGNMLFAWMRQDLERVLEDFRDRQIKGAVDQKNGDLPAGNEEGGGEQEEDPDDDMAVITIGQKQGGTPFKVFWVGIEDTDVFSTCDEVTSRDDAETLFLDVIEKKINAGVEINNGDLLFLLCSEEPPEEGSETTAYENCVYIGMFIDVSSNNQDAEPGSATIEPSPALITASTIQIDDQEQVANPEATWTVLRSVFVWQECFCEGGENEKVSTSTLTTSQGSSAGYIVSSTSGSANAGAQFTGLGEYEVNPNIYMLANPNNLNGSSASLTLKPVNDLTLNSSPVNLFNSKCGGLKKEDNGSPTSSTMLAVGSGSNTTFNVLDGLSTGDAVSLGAEDVRAFIPLLSLGNAELVNQEVQSIAFIPDPETGNPIVQSSETEEGVTTTTYKMKLANQIHYSGITTQDESPFEFDIITQTLESTDTEVTGKTGTVTELEEVDITLESEALPASGSDPAGSKFSLYKQYTTATNPYVKGRLKDFGPSVLGNKELIGEFTIPGQAAVSENDGITGSLNLLSSYDVTMESEFVEKTNDEGQTYQEAVHRIYKTSVTRTNISWIDGILTGVGADVTVENVLVGVIRVPEAPDAYSCDGGDCVKDPSGEYNDNTCDNQCVEPCTLNDRPPEFYVYVYDQSSECWLLESEHERDDSEEAQNDSLTQYYSNLGRLEADCENASDPLNPPLKFFVGSTEIIEVENQKKLTQEPLPFEQLCPDPVFPVYSKHVFQASVEVGDSAFSKTLVLDPKLTNNAHEITVEFKPGVIQDQLKLVGVSALNGETAVLLDTDSDSATTVVDSTYNHNTYSVTLPANTQQLEIIVDHTQKDLGFYSDTGWTLGIYSSIENRPFEFTELFNNEPHDFPDRIKWRHNSSCTECEQFELQHPSSFEIDGIPGMHYFDTENSCNGSECNHP